MRAPLLVLIGRSSGSRGCPSNAAVLELSQTIEQTSTRSPEVAIKDGLLLHPCWPNFLELRPNCQTPCHRSFIFCFCDSNSEYPIPTDGDSSFAFHPYLQKPSVVWPGAIIRSCRRKAVRATFNALPGAQ
jgi:hypothetical protein